jgi:hypothetical protein
VAAELALHVGRQRDAEDVAVVQVEEGVQVAAVEGVGGTPAELDVVRRLVYSVGSATR